MKKYLIALLALLVLPITAYSYPWPASSTIPDITTNPTTQQNVTATFGEVRPLKNKKGEVISKRHHFHNGVDIKANQGSKVYTVKSGQIKRFIPGDEYIRIGKVAYVHIDVELSIVSQEGQIIEAGTFIGRTNQFNHVHLIEGQKGLEINPLRLANRGEPSGGLYPFEDSDKPRVLDDIVLTPDFTSPWEEPEPFPKEDGAFVIKGNVDIIATAIDKVTIGTPSAGIYEIGYEIYKIGGDTITLAVPEKTNIRFDRIPSNKWTKAVYATGSCIGSDVGTSVFRYIVTNKIDGNDFFDTTKLANGSYRIFVIARDTDGNEGKNFVDVVIRNIVSNWPTFQHDNARTGFNPDEKIEPPFSISWSKYIGQKSG